MIARISGRLEEVSEGSALVDVGGGLWYEVRALAIALCAGRRAASKH